MSRYDALNAEHAAAQAEAKARLMQELRHKRDREERAREAPTPGAESRRQQPAAELSVSPPREVQTYQPDDVEALSAPSGRYAALKQEPDPRPVRPASFPWDAPAEKEEGDEERGKAVEDDGRGQAEAVLKVPPPVFPPDERAVVRGLVMAQLRQQQAQRELRQHVRGLTMKLEP